ncbi:MAG: hypothetical protein KKC99_02985 [Proteobacteria bacterium]|nr:hypothetical protein [Pseudomonadota bacterium]
MTQGRPVASDAARRWRSKSGDEEEIDDLLSDWAGISRTWERFKLSPGRDRSLIEFFEYKCKRDILVLDQNYDYNFPGRSGHSIYVLSSEPEKLRQEARQIVAKKIRTNMKSIRKQQRAGKRFYPRPNIMLSGNSDVSPDPRPFDESMLVKDMCINYWQYGLALKDAKLIREGTVHLCSYWQGICGVDSQIESAHIRRTDTHEELWNDNGLVLSVEKLPKLDDFECGLNLLHKHISSSPDDYEGGGIISKEAFQGLVEYKDVCWRNRQGGNQ